MPGVLADAEVEPALVIHPQAEAVAVDRLAVVLHNRLPPPACLARIHPGRGGKGVGGEVEALGPHDPDVIGASVQVERAAEPATAGLPDGPAHQGAVVAVAG